MRVWTAIGAILLWGSFAMADDLTDPQKDLILRFADAVSGGDAAMAAFARETVEDPPRELEEIGFYGLENNPASSRALRAVISKLANEGYLYDLDPDFMLWEFAALMERDGVIGDASALPPLGQGLAEVEWDDTDGLVANNRALAERLGPFAHAFVQQARDNGRVVMQVTVPLGDAVFYWVATVDDAAAWNCVPIVVEPSVVRRSEHDVIGVKPLDWMHFFSVVAAYVPDGPSIRPDPATLPDTECAFPN